MLRVTTTYSMNFGIKRFVILILLISLIHNPLIVFKYILKTCAAKHSKHTVIFFYYFQKNIPVFF